MFTFEIVLVFRLESERNRHRDNFTCYIISYTRIRKMPNTQGSVCIGYFSDWFRACQSVSHWSGCKSIYSNRTLIAFNYWSCTETKIQAKSAGTRPQIWPPNNKFVVTKYTNWTQLGKVTKKFEWVRLDWCLAIWYGFGCDMLGVGWCSVLRLWRRITLSSCQRPHPPPTQLAIPDDKEYDDEKAVIVSESVGQNRFASHAI